MSRSASGKSIDWREWSEESFAEARRKGKLVLLDLTASWCHWCHVMDESTYSDPDIAGIIGEHFVPIRVDIDRRPDISERYNRGGFPTTAFLSDCGVSIWGSTYVPPKDMKRIIEAVLKAKDSGEIDRALEKTRADSAPAPKNASERPSVDDARLSELFEDIFSAYDVEFGGFGLEPKFPHPQVLDLILMRFTETGDDELSDAVVNTIEHMASGLHDKIGGGVFRYSVTRDWMTPHYEKMLDTNLGFLSNLSHVFGTMGNRGFDRLAKDIAEYLMSNLHDPKDGGFFGSQDADEEYYRLEAEARRAKRAPSIDRTVYAGWNSDASAVLTTAGSVLAEEKMARAGRSAMEYTVEHLWNPEKGLVRHVTSEEIYLFEDQASFLTALIAQLGVSSDNEVTGLAEELISGVDRHFAAQDGGFHDILKQGDAVGDLSIPRRPLLGNSNWALALAQFGAMMHKPELMNRARQTLDSFSQADIEAHGVFGASYVIARWAMNRGFAVVEIHARDGTDPSGNRLLAAAWKVFDPSVVPITIPTESKSPPYAVVCTETGCSKKIEDPDELLVLLREIRQRNELA